MRANGYLVTEFNGWNEQQEWGWEQAMGQSTCGACRWPGISEPRVEALGAPLVDVVPPTGDAD